MKVSLPQKTFDPKSYKSIKNHKRIPLFSQHLQVLDVLMKTIEKGSRNDLKLAKHSWTKKLPLETIEQSKFFSAKRCLIIFDLRTFAPNKFYRHWSIRLSKHVLFATLIKIPKLNFLVTGLIKESRQVKVIRGLTEKRTIFMIWRTSQRGWRVLF